MTEALPLPITSLIPIVAFPLAGVLSTVTFFLLGGRPQAIFEMFDPQIVTLFITI